jgi:hypothetical protein
MADETWLDAEKAFALKLTDAIERNAAPAEDARRSIAAADSRLSARAGDAAPDRDGARRLVEPTTPFCRTAVGPARHGTHSGQPRGPEPLPSGESAMAVTIEELERRRRS